MDPAKTSPYLDRIITWSLDHPIPRVARYAIATIAIVAVGLFRAMVVTSLVPWLLFVPLVLAIGLMTGRGPGLYGALLAAVIAGVSIGSPDLPGWMTGAQWVGSGLFVLVASSTAVVGAEVRAAFARSRVLTDEKATANLALAEREAFLSSVLASSTDCIKVLDLEARLTFMSEGGQKVMEVSDFNLIAGCPWPDFWHGKGNAAAQAAIAAAREGRAANFTGRASTIAGNPRWWHVAVSPIAGADGRTERILAVSRDITATRENEEERGQLVRIIENSADFIGLSRLDGSVFFLNDAACALVGLDRARIGTVRIDDFFPPDEADRVRLEVLPQVAANGSWSGERLFRHFETGELIPVLYTVFPVLDSDGTPIGFGTVTRDFRERKRAEDQQRLLNEELGHRLKNVLAVVQSIAAQTLRQADDLTTANTALAGRLAALGQATDILTAQSWAAADLRDVVVKALAPHGGVGDRLRVVGPPITLNSQVTLALALALHELATNAAKYGALSNAAGHVELSWRIDPAVDGDEARFHLMWREVDGPPVAAPSRRGFGSTMIERTLRSYFRGDAVLDYTPAGLIFRLDAPLSEAGTSTDT